MNFCVDLGFLSILVHIFQFNIQFTRPHDIIDSGKKLKYLICDFCLVSECFLLSQEQEDTLKSNTKICEFKTVVTPLFLKGSSLAKNLESAVKLGKLTERHIQKIDTK